MESSPDQETWPISMRSRDVLAQEHRHRFADRELLTVSGDNQKAIGPGEGCDIARTTPFDGGNLRVEAPPFDPRQEEMRQAGLLLERSGQRGAKQRQRARF